MKRGRGFGFFFPLRTLLEGLQALECDFEDILVGEPSGVVHNINPEEGYDRHLGRIFRVGGVCVKRVKMFWQRCDCGCVVARLSKRRSKTKFRGDWRGESVGGLGKR